MSSSSEALWLTPFPGNMQIRGIWSRGQPSWFSWAMLESKLASFRQSSPSRFFLMESLLLWVKFTLPLISLMTKTLLLISNQTNPLGALLWVLPSWHETSPTPLFYIIAQGEAPMLWSLPYALLSRWPIILLALLSEVSSIVSAWHPQTEVILPFLTLQGPAMPLKWIASIFCSHNQRLASWLHFWLTMSHKLWWVDLQFLFCFVCFT